jgi:hypothetical protein
VKYEIGIVERLGPLMRAALADVAVTRIPPRTRMTIVARHPMTVATAVRRLHELGVEIDRIRLGTGGTAGQAGDGLTSRGAGVTR